MGGLFDDGDFFFSSFFDIRSSQPALLLSVRQTETPHLFPFGCAPPLFTSHRVGLLACMLHGLCVACMMFSSNYHTQALYSKPSHLESDPYLPLIAKVQGRLHSLAGF